MNLLDLVEDTIEGETLVQHLNNRDAAKRNAAVEANTNDFITGLMREQAAEDNLTREQLLTKIRMRQAALRNEPDSEQRRRVVDRLDELEINLHPKAE